jgi:hypothetical protein
MNQLELAALSRAASPASMRRDYFLYVDEAHLVVTTTMIELFPEARKCHLGVIVAHQYLDQLPSDLQCALLGNTAYPEARGVTDQVVAQILRRETQPASGENG